MARIPFGSLSLVTLLVCLGTPAHGLGTWDRVPLPAAAGRSLASVSASSATDAWAVGKAVYHWNGAGWSLVPAPGIGHPDPLGYADTTLRGVATIGPADAWIAGFSAFLGTPQSLALHWNGTDWRTVPSPTVAGGSNFEAVDALNANDVWAVGLRAGGLPEFLSTAATFTAHWNGSAWSAVASPNVSNRWHELLDVEMISSNDVWAVGDSRNIGEDYRTLILHWNGSAWSVVSSPNEPGDNILTGVSAHAPNDVWAVGSAWDGVTGRQIFLHWDGSAWSPVTGPGGSTACATCSNDVIAMGPSDVWAAGSSFGHWDGTRWTLVPVPSAAGAIGSTVRSLAKVGTSEAWAAGSSFDASGGDDALAVHLVSAGASPLAVGTGANPFGVRVTPNPSHDESVISLSLAAPTPVAVTILDPGGRVVRELGGAALAAGAHEFRWDGRDGTGGAAAPGLYFVSITVGDRRSATRILRLR